MNQTWGFLQVDGGRRSEDEAQTESGDKNWKVRNVSSAFSRNWNDFSVCLRSITSLHLSRRVISSSWLIEQVAGCISFVASNSGGGHLSQQLFTFAGWEGVGGGRINDCHLDPNWPPIFPFPNGADVPQRPRRFKWNSRRSWRQIRLGGKRESQKNKTNICLKLCFECRRCS